MTDKDKDLLASTKKLCEDLYKELDQIRVLLNRTGFNTARIPNNAAYVVWDYVIDMIYNGAKPGRVDALMDEVWSDFPHNHDVKKLRGAWIEICSSQTGHDQAEYLIEVSNFDVSLVKPRILLAVVSKNLKSKQDHDNRPKLVHFYTDSARSDSSRLALKFKCHDCARVFDVVEAIDEALRRRDTASAHVTYCVHAKDFGIPIEIPGLSSQAGTSDRRANNVPDAASDQQIKSTPWQMPGYPKISSLLQKEPADQSTHQNTAGESATPRPGRDASTWIDELIVHAGARDRWLLEDVDPTLTFSQIVSEIFRYEAGRLVHEADSADSGRWVLAYLNADGKLVLPSLFLTLREEGIRSGETFWLCSIPWSAYFMPPSGHGTRI